jgi:hypothetical protein
MKLNSEKDLFFFVDSYYRLVSAAVKIQLLQVTMVRELKKILKKWRTND